MRLRIALFFLCCFFLWSDVAPEPQALDSEGGAHVFEETENMVPMAVVAVAAATGKTHLVGQKVIFE